MQRCKICCMPDTRPDHVFVDGVCPACINYKNRPQIDWDKRKEELLKLLDRHDGRCIVPSSGGKDSTYQVIKLKELGADPLVVTATTCHLTDIGRKNIDNLARFATTIEVSPNKTQRAELNRLGLELVGDISWPEHVAIFSTPFRVAIEKNIPLIFYGENPQNQYGGPKGSEEARIMTRRWTQEFGGFLGLRVSDVEEMGYDMREYKLPENMEGIEAHFLGQYVPWDSMTNSLVAITNGMRHELPSESNWWYFENLDNAQTGIHDHMMYRKYGYGRGATQIAVELRANVISKDFVSDWLKKNDGLFPFEYMGVSYLEILDNLKISEDYFKKILDQYTNWNLFDGEDNMRPILKC